MKKILIALLPLLVVTAAEAQPQAYVTDQLQVTLRKGKSTQHAILRMLPSGTALEVLQTDKESGYTQVRTPDGAEGWIISRYLDDQPIARVRLRRAEQKIDRLSQENARLKEELAAVTGTKTNSDRKDNSWAKRTGNSKKSSTGSGKPPPTHCPLKAKTNP